MIRASKKYWGVVVILLTVLVASNLFWLFRWKDQRDQSQESFTQTYNVQKSDFERLSSQDNNSIIFLGDSLTDYGNWNEYYSQLSSEIKNRGIAGDTTSNLLNRLDAIINEQSNKIFLMIGINDLQQGIDPTQNYKLVLSKIRKQSPSTQVYVESILPINSALLTTKITNADIAEENAKIKNLSKEYGYAYIDVHDLFIDKNKQLSKELTIDGLHLNGKGYKIWSDFLSKYV